MRIINFFSDDKSHFADFSNPDQKYEVTIMHTVCENISRENSSTPNLSSLEFNNTNIFSKAIKEESNHENGIPPKINPRFPVSWINLCRKVFIGKISAARKSVYQNVSEF